MFQPLEPRLYMTVITQPDVYTGAQNTVLSVNGTTLPSVLANDTLGTSLPTVASINTYPSYGSLDPFADGTFNYTPVPNFHGVDSFTYTASTTYSPGGGPLTQLFNPQTHPWKYLHPLNGQDPGLTIPNFHSTWYLPDGPALPNNGSGVMGYGQIDAAPINTNIGTPPSGQRYAAYFKTTFQFTGDPYSVTDFTIDHLIDDGAFVYLNGVLIADINMEGRADSYTVFAPTFASEQPGNLVLPYWYGSYLVNGTNTLAVSVHNNSTASSDMSMAIALNVRSVEYSASTPVTITIPDGHIAPQGQADYYYMPEGGDDLAASQSVLYNDGIFTDATTIASYTQPADLPEGAIFSFDMNEGFPYLDMTAVPEYSGELQFTYTLQDKDGLSSPIPVIINVYPVNDPPVAVDDPESGATPYITFTNQTLNTQENPEDQPSLFLNDYDVDSSTFYAYVAIAPEHGTVEILPDGHFIYTPAANYSGLDSFSYQLYDDGYSYAQNLATVRLEVRLDETAPPVVVDDFYDFYEEEFFDSLALGWPSVLVNDNLLDPDGLPINPILDILINTDSLLGDLDFDPATGHFTFQPEKDFYGETSFTYQVVNEFGTSNEAIVYLYVYNVNDPPTAVDDQYTMIANQTLRTGGYQSRILQKDVWRYDDTGRNFHTLAPNWKTTAFNPDSFNWKSNQGKFGFGDPADTPLLDLDQPTFYFVRDITLSEIEAQSIQWLEMGILSDDGYVLYINGVEALRSNMPSGAVTYNTLAPVAIGGSDESAYFYRYLYTTDTSLFPDGSPFVPGVNRIAVELHQNALNSSDAGFDMYMSSYEDGRGVMLNDYDIDNDYIYPLEVVTQPQHGALFFDLYNGGTFTYTPISNFLGQDSFTYRIADGYGASSEPATVRINVLRDVSGAILAVDDQYEILEDETLQITDPAQGLMANENGIALNFTVLYNPATDGPAHGAVVMQPNGTFTYTPDPDYNGVDTFTYRLLDDEGLTQSNPATVSITLVAQPDPPQLADDAYVGYRTDQDTIFDSDSQDEPSLTDNDYFPDGPPLGIFPSSLPAGGSVIINTDGSFTFFPSPNFFGPYTFTYAAATVGQTLVQWGGNAAVPVGEHLWRFNNDNIDFGTAWRMPEFDDSFWPLGIGEFGYGDNDERTYVPPFDLNPSTGDLENNATSYFRTTFNAEQTADMDGLLMRIKRDDVAAVYFNGVEVFRDLQLHPNATHNSYAIGSYSRPNDGNNDFFETHFVASSFIHDGLNTIAVEIHQANNESTDLSFDFELSALHFSYADATIQVDPQPDPPQPIGLDDSFEGYEDAPLSGDVLFNEFGPELTVELLGAGPGHGSLQLNPDGTFLFTPDPDYNSLAYNFNKPLQFQYVLKRQVSGGTLVSDPVNVSLYIHPVADEASPVGDTYFIDGPGSAIVATYDFDVNIPIRAGGALQQPQGNHVWRYLDAGRNPGLDWMKPDYDDGAWESGVGEFGYGDGDERTIVDVIDANPVFNGTQPNAATYFRTTFTVPNGGATRFAVIETRYDDGFAIYLNGHEIQRVNLSPYADYTLHANNESSDNAMVFYVIPLVEGTIPGGVNTLAVEMHNGNMFSSDQSFDLSLTTYEALSNKTVVANDHNPDGRFLTVALYSTPQFHDDQGGANPFFLTSNGEFAYTAGPGFTGHDSFTYRILDDVTGLWSAPATVHIRVQGLRGDLNGDNLLNAADIDSLFAHIRNGEPYDLIYDLNGDGVVDQDDVEQLVTDPDLLNTVLCDANLNGAASLGDLIILAANYAQPGGWALGDFNGDGVISMGDLTLLAEHFGSQRPGELIGEDGAAPAAANLIGLDALGLTGTTGSNDDDDSDDETDPLADILDELGQELRG